MRYLMGSKFATSCAIPLFPTTILMADKMHIPSFLTTLLTTAEKLDDENYAQWAEILKMFLMGIGASFVTLGTPPTEEDKKGIDKMLLPYIYASMAPEQRWRIKDLTSASTAWGTLKMAYTKSTMGRCIHACDTLDAINHDPTRSMDFYIQSVTNAFQRLKDLGEQIANTAIGDHLLRHLDESYHPVHTSILAQESEPDLSKIKSILRGSASSEVLIKIESGFFSKGGKSTGGPLKGKTPARDEPATEGFREGKFKWCNKDNGDSCHRCGHSGHISQLCARDMPSAIKDLVIQGAHAHATQHMFQGELQEQLSKPEDDGPTIYGHGAIA
ncbi:hypothetical protein FA15DRAFT_655267 [Coprinopsis marcescibilis]|uniref:CCHC-type domain-containing protein n=1 Tax=Coprinopsis marcescibilis TaxID=230819 RepID=A0A5C3KXC9_COPMA|nr:hypothetical protein FA15DRAFT_655267 [Coprinopsis marcescibilis]